MIPETEINDLHNENHEEIQKGLGGSCQANHGGNTRNSLYRSSRKCWGESNLRNRGSGERRSWAGSSSNFPGRICAGGAKIRDQKSKPGIQQECTQVQIPMECPIHGPVLFTCVWCFNNNQNCRVPGCAGADVKKWCQREKMASTQ